MEQFNYIEVKEFCHGHGISTQFIVQLHDFGLIEIVKKKDAGYIAFDELPKIEKIVRLHNDLNINLEGIEVIHQLLDRIEHMRNEIISLRNKVDFYE
ncbi:MAG: MerR family transcriptional regulator [Maribacter sp.]|nr:MAG: MerR family transcriptional regulator [Maribacter sp.]